jgi:hypothetical protein
MPYDKMNDYAETIYHVFKMVNDKATKQQDKKMKYISVLIFKYLTKIVTEYKINLKNVEEALNINLIPVFEYISFNNIELLDFNTIKMEDIDITNEADIERFVLSHVYYITQK